MTRIQSKNNIFIALFGTFLLVGGLAFMFVMFEVVGASDTVENETVEIYEMDLMGSQGHVKKNAITKIKENKRELVIHTISVEDFYDQKKNFIRSQVIVEEAINNYHQGTIKKVAKSKEFDAPQTIINITKPEDYVEQATADLTADEEETIKMHLKELIEQDGFKTEETTGKGITRKEKERIEKMKEKYEYFR